MEIDWFRRPFLVSGLLAVAACLAAVFSPVVGGVIIVCLLLLLFAVPGYRRGAVAVIFVCFALFLLSTLWRHHAAMRLPERLAGKSDTVTGVVVQCPDSGRMYTIELTDSTLLPAGTRVVLFCPDMAAPQMYERMSATVEWHPLYEQRQYTYWADGVFLMGYPADYGEESVAYAETEENSVRHTLFDWRESLAERLWQGLPGEDGAVLAGLCLGQDSRLTDTTYAAFCNSGLPHLLVVSGLHVTAFATAVFWLTRFLRLGRRLRVVCPMAGVGLFCLLVGLSPSVLRAATACLIMLAGQLLRRRPDSLNSMGFALTVLLVWNPYAVFDIGLQLSFCASAGVVLLSPRLKEALTAALPEERSGWRWLLCLVWERAAGALSVSLGATLFLTPLLCLLFRRLSVYTLLANLLTVAVAGWALVLGFVLLCIPDVGFFHVLQQIVARLAEMACRWLRGIAHLLGAEKSTVYVGRLWQSVFVVGACVLLGVLLLADKRGLCRRVACCLCGLFLLAHGVTMSLSADTVTVRVIAQEDTAALLLSKEGRHALLLPDGTSLQPVQYAMRNSPCEALDFVWLAQGEPADAGTLKAVLDVAPAARVLSGTADWAMGCPYTVESVDAEDEISFWTNCRATYSPAGWWRLEMGNSSLIFVFAQAQTCPPADCVLAVQEALRVWPEAGQYIVLCEGETTTAAAPESAVAVAAEQPCYLSTRGNGDWSVTRWE